MMRNQRAVLVTATRKWLATVLTERESERAAVKPTLPAAGGPQSDKLEAAPAPIAPQPAGAPQRPQTMLEWYASLPDEGAF